MLSTSMDCSVVGVKTFKYVIGQVKFHFAQFEVTALGLLMVYGNNLKIKPYPKNAIETAFLKDQNTDSDPLRFLPSFHLSWAKILSLFSYVVSGKYRYTETACDGGGDFSLVKCKLFKVHVIVE